MLLDQHDTLLLIIAWSEWIQYVNVYTVVLFASKSIVPLDNVLYARHHSVFNHETASEDGTIVHLASQGMNGLQDHKYKQGKVGQKAQLFQKGEEKESARTGDCVKW